MTPQELKNSILQLAIQGKLVEQRPEEGTAQELYAQIQAEKQRLIKEGKLKKEKPLPEITEDEKPFEIPEGWMWVRIGDCVSDRTGLSYKKDFLQESSEKMIRVLRGGNIGDTKYFIKPDDIFISSKYVKSDLFLKRNTLITPAVTSLEHIGKMGRIEADYDNIVVGGFVLMLSPYYSLDEFAQYLLYCFSSNYVRTCCKGIVNKSGQAFYNLSRKKLLQVVIPLPPLAEQKRIVVKIEELLPLVDRYEQAWTKMEDFNHRFPEDMKKSILQQAIQGKLVEQRPEEGTAQELYAQIQTEKQRLIQSGKLKKEKPLPEITEDEKPFEIPEGWMWVHLNYIANSSLGKTLDKVKNTGDYKPYLCSINVYWNGISLEKVKEARFEETELEKYSLKRGDLLICEGGDVGRSAVWEEDIPMCYQNALHRVRFYHDINPYFYKYLIECYKGIGIINQFSKGVTIKHLVQSSLNAMWLPLPPLAEQKRIVAKIEELLPLVDRYEQAWTKLEDFNRRFPEDMKKSILQQAIQGKLVEQRPEEGTAQELYAQIQAEKQRLIKEGKIKKEKPLPEITEEEKPFEIPEGWMWVRLGEICKSISDGDHQPPPQVPEGVPFLVISNVSAGRIDFSSTRYVPQDYFNTLSNDRIAQKGDILFTVTGSYGIPIKVESDEKFCFQRHIALLKLMLDWDYIFYILKSPTIKSQCDAVATGTAQKTVGLKSLRNLIVPLPPLAEQKRIVEKLEELLPMCEKLK